MVIVFKFKFSAARFEIIELVGELLSLKFHIDCMKFELNTKFGRMGEVLTYPLFP